MSKFAKKVYKSDIEFQMKDLNKNIIIGSEFPLTPVTKDEVKEIKQLCLDDIEKYKRYLEKDKGNKEYIEFRIKANYKLIESCDIILGGET